MGADIRDVRIGVLGPLTVDAAVTGLQRRDRVVLAALAARAGEAVSPERLADALWGDQLPASWAKVLQNCIVRLRKRLDSPALETTPHGYRLRLPPVELDSVDFERLLARGRELLTLGDPDRAAFLLGEAVGLWRGPALDELENWDSGRAEATRLNELRLDAEELLLESSLRLGRHREVLATARARVEESPTRERRWALLALAEYQSGRQAEALRTLAEVRSMLSREFGLDRGPDLAALEDAIRRQDPALVADVALPEARPTCPYRGLVRYDVSDAQDFFGRDQHVSAGLRRLAATGALIVVGPSGSGKSSLVRAGLAATLQRDGRRVVVITPGPHPMDALTALPEAGRAPVLVVDQCEEAALCANPAERADFFSALTAHTERAPLIVAVRADRLGDLSTHPDFTRLVERSLYLLTPMTPDDLRAAIEGPARAAGLRLEAGLVDLLVREVEGEPGALPLLSHALRATWEQREASTLTVAGYRASGGVRGAVARSAESLYQRIPPEQRPQLRDLLLRLIAPNPAGDPLRSRLPRRLVAGRPQLDRLIETLVTARLLTSDEGVLELAHEALVRAWPRFQEWLDEDAEGQRIVRHLVGAADTWDSMNRPDSELYRGTRLAKALEWRDQAHPDLTATEIEFLDASRVLAEAEEQEAAEHVLRQKRINRRLRGLLVGVALLTVAALVATAIAVNQRTQSGRERQVALRQRNEAVALALALASRDVADGNGALALALATESSAATSPPLPEATAALLQARLAFAQNALQPVGGPHFSHDGEVTSLAFSADGKKLATGGDDGYVRLWDPRTGHEVPGAFATGAQPVTWMAFGSRGHLLASASPDPGKGTEIRLWNTDTGRAAGSPFRQGSLLTAAALSSGGDLLASAGRDGLVRVWDQHTGNQLNPALRPGGWVTKLAFSADGRLLVTASDLRPGGAIRVWDPRTGRPVGPVHRLASKASSVTFSPDGRLLAIAYGGFGNGNMPSWVRVWNPLNGGPVGRPIRRNNGVSSLAFSPDSKLLATAGGSDSGGIPRLWNAETGRPVGTPLTGLAGTITSVAFNPVWRRHQRADDESAVRYDGYLLATAGSEGEIRLWEVAAPDPEPPTPTGQPSTVNGVAFSPDGSLLATASRDGYMRQWTSDTGLPAGAPVQAHAGQLFAVAFSPDGEKLATAGDKGMQLWDASTGHQLPSPLQRVGSADLVKELVTFSPDWDLVALVESDGPQGRSRVRFADPTTGATVGKPASRTFVTALAISPSGEMVATIDREGFSQSVSHVRLWDVATGREVHSLRLVHGATSLVFNPPGDLLAIASPDAVRLWDTATGDLVGGPLTGHAWGGVTAVAFSPDGNLMATGGSYGGLRLWNPVTGEPVGGLLVGHTEAVKSIAFSPVGKSLASIAHDGTLHLWHWDLEGACQLAGTYVTAAQVARYLPSGWHPKCHYAD